MPIQLNYNPDIRALGRIAQFGGEGAYRQQLNQLATSDTNRRVSTQLSLADLMEGARRTNVNAQVSMSNQAAQIQAAQAQAQYARQSNERMAQYQAAQQQQRQQQAGRLNSQQAAAQFQRQQQLGQQQFGQRKQLGEQGFGFDQQMQEQRDFSLDQRQQAQFRQVELGKILPTLDPQAQGQIRTINFQRQKFMEDQRKRPILRDDEFQGQLGQFDQRINEVIQNAQKQPTPEEIQQDYDGSPWDYYPGTKTPVKLMPRKDGGFEFIAKPESAKEPKPQDPDFSVKEQYERQNKYNTAYYKQLQSARQASQEAMMLDPNAGGFDENAFRADYERVIPRFSGGAQPASPQQAPPPAQQAGPQQPPTESQAALQQLMPMLEGKPKAQQAAQRAFSTLERYSAQITEGMAIEEAATIMPEPDRSTFTLDWKTVEMNLPFAEPKSALDFSLMEPGTIFIDPEGKKRVKQ